MEPAVHFNEGGTRGVVRLARGFFEVKHRNEASIRSVEQSGPFIARLVREDLFKLATKGRPLRAVILARQIVRRVEAKTANQLGEEFGFKRAYSDELAIGAAIGPIEREAAIEKVMAARLIPKTASAEAEDHCEL